MEATINTRPSKLDLDSSLKERTHKLLLWVGLASVIMFFAGLTSAVVVSKASSIWVEFSIPSAFYTSTVIILISSVSFQIALWQLKKGNFSLGKSLLLATFLLAIGFCASQFMAWQDLYAQGIIAAGKGSNASGSYFYAITALHLAHVAIGLISLIVVLIKTFRNKYSVDKLLGVKLSVTYWHFLGVLWVYLFVFLKFTLTS